MHEESLLWVIDAEYFILKFQSKMADRWLIRGFPILNIWEHKDFISGARSHT